jgi:hypothetical protein
VEDIRGSDEGILAPAGEKNVRQLTYWELSQKVDAEWESQAREHVQRLGRILRPRVGKFAILYEVVSRDTVEEGISRRRKGEAYKPEPEPLKPRLNSSPFDFAPVGADDLPDFDDLGKVVGQNSRTNGTARGTGLIDVKLETLRALTPFSR